MIGAHQLHTCAVATLLALIGKSKTDAGLEFVYLLKWPDKQTMTAQWEKFLADLLFTKPPPPELRLPDATFTQHAGRQLFVR